MSHFVVLVIGPDVDKQLAPFHEFECTGVDDEFVQEVEDTDDVRATWEDDDSHGQTPFADWARGYYGRPVVRPGETPDKAETHKYGWIEVDEKGELLRSLDRTNPNARWDWYVVGGRWTGSLKLKEKALGAVGRPGLMTEPAPPGYADQARKGDVDIAGMRLDAEIKGRALWKTTREITGGASWESWDDTLLRHGKDNVEAARAEYYAQPAIELLKAVGKAGLWGFDDDLALEEEVYVRRCRDSACVFFAFLREGQWIEKGQMGWFGMATDEVSDAQWNARFNAMLDELPDDTLLTIVDCHI